MIKIYLIPLFYLGWCSMLGLSNERKDAKWI